MPALSSKNLVEIADVRENVAILRNGSLRIIIEVTAINFELRSEEEQNAILQNFQFFLNAVDFPIQIIINSRRFNIEEYLKNVEVTTAPLQNELLKLQASEYMKFVKELSELSNIMSKKFYIVVPFYTTALPSGKGILDGLKGIFSSSASSTSVQIPDEQFASYRTQITQRAELIFNGLIGMGMKTRILSNEELINLFYSIYNPGSNLKV